jgi:hypothetical protein
VDAALRHRVARASRRPVVGDHHDHCDVLSRGRAPRVAQRVPAVRAPATQRQAGATRAYELAKTPEAPLRYAPKTSPPIGGRVFGSMIGVCFA